MKLKLKRKISLVWIQHLELLRKLILLHDLEIFSLLVEDGCSRLGVGFVRLRNQNVTSIGIQEKIEDLGEKMKTRVSKISLGSRAKK